MKLLRCNHIKNRLYDRQLLRNAFKVNIIFVQRVLSSYLNSSHPASQHQLLDPSLLRQLTAASSVKFNLAK